MNPLDIILTIIAVLAVIALAAVLAHFIVPAWYKKTVAPVAPTVDPLLQKIHDLVSKQAAAQPPAPANVIVTVTAPTAQPPGTQTPVQGPTSPSYIPGSDADPKVIANKAKIAHFIATAQCDPSKVDVAELGRLLTVPAHPSLGGGMDFATGAVEYDAGSTPDASLMIQGKIITNVPISEAEKVFITNNVPTFYWTSSDAQNNIIVTRSA